MNALVLMLLAGVGQVPGATEWRNWHSDYGVALSMTKQVKKPLLVVLNEPRGSEKTFEPVSLTRDPAATNLLRHFTLCRIDVSTPYGKSVAKAFRATRFPHMVVIDRTGKWKLFKKTGQLSTADWTASLTRHQAGTRPVSVGHPSAVYCPT